MTLPKMPLETKPNLAQRCARVVVAVILACIAFVMLGFVSLLVPGPSTEEKTIVVAHGERVADIGSQLAQENLVHLAFPFRVAARLVASNTLKAGEYAIPAHASVIDIALMMHQGKMVIRLFTIAEGLTSAETVRLLNDDPVLTGTIANTPDEGSLLPETYQYSYGDDRQHLITRMQKAMQDKVNDIWARRDAVVPLQSPQQMVTLASIVEKETGKPAERPRIAGVFYNRLHANMRLQSDPTVIYAITRGEQILPRALTHDDLSFASPFNTYASDGLPPHAICNPGTAAMEAVAHPEHHNFLYFVADGSGGHAFAADLATQDANINRWHQMMENHAVPK